MYFLFEAPDARGVHRSPRASPVTAIIFLETATRPLFVDLHVYLWGGNVFIFSARHARGVCRSTRASLCDGDKFFGTQNARAVRRSPLIPTGVAVAAIYFLFSVRDTWCSSIPTRLTKMAVIILFVLTHAGDARF